MTYLSLPQDTLVLKPAKIVSHQYFRDIKKISEHILMTGLLNPLIVAEKQGRYIVLDGAKRLLAIHRLTRSKTLPRTLNRIPCIIVEETSQLPNVCDKPLLLSEADLVHGIIMAANDGLTNSEICKKFDCSEDVVLSSLRVQCLHPKLQSAFSNGTISLKQAAVFASFPNLKSQWQLLLALGPFASDAQILDAISDGETVLELKSGEVIILPSRTPNPNGGAKTRRANQNSESNTLAA